MLLVYFHLNTLLIQLGIVFLVIFLHVINVIKHMVAYVLCVIKDFLGMLLQENVNLVVGLIVQVVLEILVRDVKMVFDLMEILVINVIMLQNVKFVLIMFQFVLNVRLDFIHQIMSVCLVQIIVKHVQIKIHVILTK